MRKRESKRLLLNIKGAQMNKEKSLSIIIPAFNEGRNLEAAVETIDKSARQIFEDYELLILNDGSTDNTAETAEQLAKKNPKVKFFDFKINRGLGAMYREGIMRANKDYVIMLPGDNETEDESVTEILSHAGEADIVLSYTVNKEARPWVRRIVSASFTTLLNTLFRLHLRYYNGLAVYETSLIKKAKMTTNSFAFQAEILVHMIRAGHSYKEVPMRIRPHQQLGKNVLRIFKIKNVIGVLTTIVRLFFDVYFHKQTKRDSGI